MGRREERWRWRRWWGDGRGLLAGLCNVNLYFSHLENRERRERDAEWKRQRKVGIKWMETLLWLTLTLRSLENLQAKLGNKERGEGTSEQAKYASHQSIDARSVRLLWGETELPALWSTETANHWPGLMKNGQRAFKSMTLKQGVSQTRCSHSKLMSATHEYRRTKKENNDDERGKRMQREKWVESWETRQTGWREKRHTEDQDWDEVKEEKESKAAGCNRKDGRRGEMTWGHC